MTRSVKVTLDGIEFEVPAMNVGQLEDVAETTAGATVGNVGLKILRIAMRRSTPKPDFETLAPTVDECGNAVRAIMELSGLQKPDANPPGTPKADTP